jgi:hypothetical protein
VVVSDPASGTAGKTDTERLLHYRELAAQFRQWAADETVLEAQEGLPDIARHYDRLAVEQEIRIATAT